MMKGERAIDYLSKSNKLTDCEYRFDVGKDVLGVWATQRLRHYPLCLFRSPVGKDGSDEISV